MSSRLGADADHHDAPVEPVQEPCWHCGTRAADPVSTRPLQLRRYRGSRVERTQVLVPACRTCHRARRAIGLLWTGMLLAGVVVATVGVIAIAGSPDKDVRTLWALLITLPPFVLVLPVGLIGQLQIVKRAGIRNLSRVAYPPVQQFRRDGWTTVRVTKGTYRAGQTALAALERLDEMAEEGRRTIVVKSCSRCHQPVAPTAHAGQRCPHCGVYWNTETTERWG